MSLTVELGLTPYFVFCVIAMCSILAAYQHVNGRTASVFNPEDGGSMLPK